jgi:hypothetical protein
MEESLRQFVWQRATGCCEYCRLPQSSTLLPHGIDHIIAQKHDGPTVSDNLCLACYSCNAYKGPNIAGLDPRTNQLTRLFHPRRDQWDEHFFWDGPILIAKTPLARATIAVLRINQPQRVAHRQLLSIQGVFPPR